VKHRKTYPNLQREVRRDFKLAGIQRVVEGEELDYKLWPAKREREITML
jgi:hypothetical protein